MVRPIRAALLYALCAVHLVCGCSRRREQRIEAPAVEDRLAARPSSLDPSPREPGPPHKETDEQLRSAGEECRSLVDSLLTSGISPREVASTADIRGYRLYRRRYFGQARVWFEAATRTDPTYEPGLLNAARVAALLGDLVGAREHLRRLRAIGTPLSRSRLSLMKSDPDFAKLWEKSRPDELE